MAEETMFASMTSLEALDQFAMRRRFDEDETEDDGFELDAEEDEDLDDDLDDDEDEDLDDELDEDFEELDDFDVEDEDR
jgi:hypothetical protein